MPHPHPHTSHPHALMARPAAAGTAARALEQDAMHPALHAVRGAGLSTQTLAQVLAFYDEPHRVYHDRTHVREMLDHALTLPQPLSAEQGLAVLFHDAVYVPGAPNGANEALSAQLMRVYAGHLPRTLVGNASSIIIDTIDHLPRSPAAAAVLDLDLLRLAAAPPRFADVSQQVFAEWRPLLSPYDEANAWAQFAQCQADFFRLLLKHEFIYALPEMRTSFEAMARRNLEQAITEATALANVAATAQVTG